ncbi:Oidioi.mRNA.OKI2018_I69.chr1.g1729.t1.cds [Oikopleura dioica]|uniref:Oidioi.mRNA.OKI2018_I69.chr1.g1729.t1.cds n=1 Tax=Oikopleura dioica TaxID=34765 RepID=A0ABN7SNU1_OIKDI|nr:Oidioi.mRNA.OKI2018_I69.chr1.g1729.t1.cds [Oikopleura dioica]
MKFDSLLNPEKAVDSTVASVVALDEYSRRIHSPDKELLLVHICQTKTSNDDIRGRSSHEVLEKLLAGEERANAIKEDFIERVRKRLNDLSEAQKEPSKEFAARKKINIIGFKIFMIDEKIQLVLKLFPALIVKVAI